MFIVFGRDTSLILWTREISLRKNNSHDLHRVITHSLVLVIIPCDVYIISAIVGTRVSKLQIWETLLAPQTEVLQKWESLLAPQTEVLQWETLLAPQTEVLQIWETLLAPQTEDLQIWETLLASQTECLNRGIAQLKVRIVLLNNHVFYILVELFRGFSGEGIDCHFSPIRFLLIYLETLNHQFIEYNVLLT